jgi:hypothetical protein
VNVLCRSKYFKDKLIYPDYNAYVCTRVNEH